MSKKRTIDEIIESILKLVNQAKNKGNNISHSASKVTIGKNKNKDFEKNIIKKREFDKNDQDGEKTNTKKDKYSDWSNIKFNKVFNKENVNIRKKIKVLVEKKMKEKFEYEIQKWIEKKIPRLLEIEMKKKTKIVYKKN